MPGAPRSGWLQALTLLTQLGLTFILSLLISFLIGYGLDRWLGTGFIFQIVFLFVGIVAGGWSCYRLLKPFMEG
ncbi:AtpZ/AtpI family protein [Candidatus Acetothermia bacterium]|nr:AtpZ/AtpI family protein [Candidatus Acetothermia bacterium]MBI3660794.1 AtpZ/AtpI family protein [Candidatus Acetothermia bacterium]